MRAEARMVSPEVGKAETRKSTAIDRGRTRGGFGSWIKIKDRVSSCNEDRELRVISDTDETYVKTCRTSSQSPLRHSRVDASGSRMACRHA